MTNNLQGKVVGFIGIGVMGKSMASHIMKAGYRTVIYTRTKHKAESLIEAGAEWKDSVAHVAEEADIVISMIGMPQDVEQTYFGKDGLIENVRPGTYLIDMTTSSPTLARRIYEQAKARRLHALDAPVSGGDVGAREARLSIMVGGDEADVEAMRSIFGLLGQKIVHQGGAGAGQYTKLCNQIAIASNMIGVCEALSFAKNAGLDPENVMRSIESGAAGSWSLSNLGPRMLAGDYAPGFFIKHFVKDMNIALESAKELGLEAPGLELALSLYRKLESSGDAESGTQALFKAYGR